jgi:hypothetical protein
VVSNVPSRSRERPSVLIGMSETGSPVGPRGRQVTLIDVLDRLLGGGVVIQGHITLAAADIDLVEVDLGILVGSIDKVWGQ